MALLGSYQVGGSASKPLTACGAFRAPDCANNRSKHVSGGLLKRRVLLTTSSRKKCKNKYHPKKINVLEHFQVSGISRHENWRQRTNPSSSHLASWTAIHCLQSFQCLRVQQQWHTWSHTTHTELQREEPNQCSIRMQLAVWSYAPVDGCLVSVTVAASSIDIVADIADATGFGCVLSSGAGPRFRMVEAGAT